MGRGIKIRRPKAGSKNLKDKMGMNGKTERRSHEDEFNAFLNAKIDVMKKGNPEMAEKEITDEEKTQAKDIFAKIRIYRNEFDENPGPERCQRTSLTK